ncbi:Uridylate kinase PUMPKIN, chloroplastic [Linum grandiflorum]
MATEDFPLIDAPPPPPPPPVVQPDSESGQGGGDNYYPTYPDSDQEKSGSAAPATPSSKRNHDQAEQQPDPAASQSQSQQYYNSSSSKRQRSNGKSAEPESTPNADYRTDYRKDREEWSDSAISCLLDAYMEKYSQLSRGNLRGRDWEVVAETVNERGGPNSRKSVEQCKNKIDNLKKRYKVEIQRITSNGGGGSNWHWFKQIEAIIGQHSSGGGGSKAVSGGGASVAVPAESEPSADTATATGYEPSIVCGIAKSQLFSHRHTRSSAAAAFASNLKSTKSSQPTLKWRRVVFKISGTALSGTTQNIDPKIAMQIATEVAAVRRHGLEVAIVVGARNFFCGDSWISATGLDRPTAYQIGMMGTVMNSVLLQSALEKHGIQARVQSAFSMPELAEPYSRLRAIRHLEKGRVVIFGGVGAGAGNPLFTTDTAAALRASELNADALLKGTNINGIYDWQASNSNIILDHTSFRDVVSGGATTMDMMAINYCEENGIPVVVFNMLEPGNISRALCGEQVGTLIDQAGGGMSQ